MIIKASTRGSPSALGRHLLSKVVVFHEKEGRRHAHAVWSRIDPETMTVKKLPYFKTRLQEIAKQLYIDHGWDLPKGFVRKAERDPTNFTLAEWQQAKRDGVDPRHLKTMAAEAWALGKDTETFAQELQKRGLYLAKGDRRGHVAVSYQGEVYAIARLLNKKTKEISDRLGKADDLRSVDETRQLIQQKIAPVLRKLMEGARQDKQREMSVLEMQRHQLVSKHRLERDRMEAGLRARQETEARERSLRLQQGLVGLWQALSGKAKAIIERNQREADEALKRDRAYSHSIITAQISERQKLQTRIDQARKSHQARLLEIHRDYAQTFDKAAKRNQEPITDRFNAKAQSRAADWLKANLRRMPPRQQAQSPSSPTREHDRGLDL